jgi:hypothetical protein
MGMSKKLARHEASLGRAQERIAMRHRREIYRLGVPGWQSDPKLRETIERLKRLEREALAAAHDHYAAARKHLTQHFKC